MVEWNVKLAVSGPITVSNSFTLNVEKGYNYPFWTTVKIKKATQGVWTEVIARAETADDANDAAVFYIGQTLDVLCLRTGRPLYVSLFDEKFRSYGNRIQRIIQEREWKEAFRISRQYGLNRRIYSRALSWFRKGLTSEDPVDKFIAFWSSLEGFGSACARKTERTKLGCVNQICDCFDQLWGDVSNWKVITNDAEQINRFQEIRNGIAHGSIELNVDTIRQISNHLPLLHKLAHTFLSEWEHHGIQDFE